MKLNKSLRLMAGALALTLLMSQAAFAQVQNTATGSIAGNVGSVTSGSISLSVNTLEVKKEAYDLAGNLLAANNGTGTVAKGQTIWVYIYLQNISTGQINDLRLEDNLNDKNGDGTVGDATGLGYVGNLEYSLVSNAAPVYSNLSWTTAGSGAIPVTVSGDDINAIVRLGRDRQGSGTAYDLPGSASIAIRFQAIVK